MSDDRIAKNCGGATHTRLAMSTISLVGSTVGFSVAGNRPARQLMSTDVMIFL